MSTLVSILAVGLLIALHEMGHFIAARRMGMKVLRFSVGLLHSIASWTSKKSGVVYQIGVIPFGGFVQIKGMNPFEEGAYDDPESYQTKPAWRRVLVLVAGPFANLLIAWAILFGLYMGGHPEPLNEPRVGFTVPGEPAEKAGILRDDLVLKLNNEPLSTWSDLASKLHGSPDKAVTLEIERENKNLTIEVVPANKNGIGLIGIGQATKIVYLPPHIAAAAAGIKCYQVVAGNLTALAGLVSGQAGDMQPVGPVGIVKMAATTLDTGFREFLALVALLSLMLFLFNLLPLPALDGGRGVFLLFEIITRRRVSPRVDVIVNATGFLLLISLILMMSVRELFF